MSRIHLQRGRKGTGTEYYEYKIVNPKVVIQKYGEWWYLGVTHLDGSWQVAAYFPKLEDAKMVGRKLIEQYATGIFPNVSDYRKVATDLCEQYEHLTTAGTQTTPA